MLSDYWILLIGVVAVVALAVLLGVLVTRRRSSDVGRVVHTVAIDSAHDVLAPNGMGGQIHIEYLLLTAQGLVVVDFKRFEGTIFGSDRMDEWTVIANRRRFTFPNPQNALYDRVAAIRRLVREIPVTGHVVFSSGADFSKGRPRDVLLAEEFTEQYRKPEKTEIERLRETFAPYWERLRESLQAAQTAS